MEYRTETKAKKKAYARLKQIARLQGTTPPPNPYPSVIKEIQAEEDVYLRERYTNPKIIAIAEKMKADEAAKERERDRFRIDCPCYGEVANFLIVSKMAALELQCHGNGEPQAF
ncbi:hypothetical protein D5086_020337 [Populus alba]|uniref:Uncharacterized protein n=1 Tax=Populus alba TaxID=43335 RepID=A0ACC4BJS0_POPAL